MTTAQVTESVSTGECRELTGPFNHCLMFLRGRGYAAFIYPVPHVLNTWISSDAGLLNVHNGPSHTQRKTPSKSVQPQESTLQILLYEPCPVLLTHVQDEDPGSAASSADHLSAVGRALLTRRSGPGSPGEDAWPSLPPGETAFPTHPGSKGITAQKNGLGRAQRQPWPRQGEDKAALRAATPPRTPWEACRQRVGLAGSHTVVPDSLAPLPVPGCIPRLRPPSLPVPGRHAGRVTEASDWVCAGGGQCPTLGALHPSSSKPLPHGKESPGWQDEVSKCSQESLILTLALNHCQGWLHVLPSPG